MIKEPIEIGCGNCPVMVMCRVSCNNMNILEDLIGGCRWYESLILALKRSGGNTVLRLRYEDDYQGYVDIDVLLGDGRVFSYSYSYGSCSGCDSWEDSEFDTQDGERLMSLIIQEATFFDNTDDYSEWIKRRPKDY